MKVLLAGPAEKRRKTEYLIKKAVLSLGHEVHVFDDRLKNALLGKYTDRSFKKTVDRLSPDLVLFSKAKKLTPSSIKYASEKCRTAMWYFDANIPLEPGIAERAKYVDVFFITNSSQLKEFEDLGVKRAEYLPQACSTEYELPGYEDLYDISFIGSNNGGSESFRTKLLLQAANKYDVHVWGRGWKEYAGRINYVKNKVYEKGYAQICRRSRIIIEVRSFNSLIGMRGYFSNRVWLTLGFGGFLLAQNAPGIGEYIENGKHAVFFDSIPEAIDMMDYYLQNDDEREKIRSAGYELAVNNHTYVHRVKKILEITGLNG